MPTQPIFSYNAVSFSSDLYYILGDQWPNRLDGTQPFSIGGWFRVTAENEGAILLNKENELQIGFNLNQVTSQFLSGTGQSTVYVFNNFLVDLNVWHYLLFTYQNSGETGSLNLYVDGVHVGEIAVSQIVATTSSNNDVFFGDADVDALNLSIWNTCLQIPPGSSGITPDWTVESASPNLVAAYDFSVVPPIDTSGNNMPIVPSDIPPVTALLNQGLTLNGSAYALPSTIDSLDPGNGTNPFTIHCWLLASTPSPLFGTQYGLFCNGEFTTSGSLVVGLTYDEGTFKFGVSDAGSSYLGNPFGPNQWHHVAVTYDGNTITVYDNGQPSRSFSSVALPAIATPSPMIGACADSTVPGGFNIPFLGQIQSLGIWPTSLSASDIQTYMTTPPDATTACLAFYDLGTPQPVNSITGSPLALYGGGVTSESFQAESAPAVARRPNAVSSGKPSPTIYDLKPSAEMDLSVRPKSKVLSDNDIDRLIADYGKILSAIAPESRRAEFRAAFQKNLYLGIHLHELSGGYVPGTITTAVVGDHHVFYEHSLSGPQEIARVGTAVLSQCTAWLLGVIASAIGLLFLAFGLGFSAATVVNRVLIPAAYRWGYGTEMSFAKLFLEVPVSAYLPVKVARTMWNSGMLVSAIMQGLAGVSWWSWAWTVANLAVSIVSLWASGGFFLLYILAQLAVSLAQLIQLIREKPAGCYS